MTITCVNICDSGIVVTRGSEIIDVSPGIAILRKNEVITGVEAASQQYLIPQFSFSRFWKELNQRKLPSRDKRIRHNADLAYAHLKDIVSRSGEMNELVVAVPSEYGEEELALLAGIFEALKIKINAIVDSNVASLSGWAPEGNYSVLQVNLHHSTVSRLKVADRIILEDVNVIENIGWNMIHHKIANYAAKNFLEQTRFYPFHQGQSEQLLYNQVPEFIRSAKIASTFDASIAHHGVAYTTHLKSESLSREIREPITILYREVEGSRTRVVISKQFAELPGVDEIFSNYHVIGNDSCATGVSLHKNDILRETNNLYLINEFPKSKTPIFEHTEIEKRKYPSEVTHLLSGNHALPLRNTPLLLNSIFDHINAVTNSHTKGAEVLLSQGKAIIKPNNQSVTLNSKTVANDRSLEVGDQIVTFPNHDQYTAISIIEEDAL